MDLSKRTYVLSFPFKSVIYKNYVLKTCKNINFKWWNVNIMKNELGFKGYLNKGRLSLFFYISLTQRMQWWWCTEGK